MKSLVLYPTETAQWQALINEAEAACALHLGEDLQQYLVLLLMRFASQPQFIDSVLAVEFLEAAALANRQRQSALRDVGDKCLLLSGLFPRRAERLRLNLSYFVDLGRSAYATLSSQRAQYAHLFMSLSDRFIHLMDVLQATRAVQTQQPTSPESLLLAIEMWQETGSERAYSLIQQAANDAIMPFQSYLKRGSSH